MDIFQQAHHGESLPGPLDANYVLKVIGQRSRSCRLACTLINGDCSSCRRFCIECCNIVLPCVQSNQLESDNETAEKKRRRRRKYEDETDTSDEVDESDDDDDDADDDDGAGETDKHHARRRSRARKNLVHGFTAPEIRRLIKSIKKFPRPTDRSVIRRDMVLFESLLLRSLIGASYNV